MKIDTITYCFCIEHWCPNPGKALIRVDATLLVAAFSVFRALLVLKALQLFPQTLRAKGAHPTLKEFTRQGQHLACIPTPHSPLKEAAVLVELNNVPQPCLTR
jgi:hypothetical protein